MKTGFEFYSNDARLPRISRYLVIAIFAMSLVLLIANVSAQEASFLADLKEGQRIFRSKGCQQCHAIRGRGGDIGKDLGWHEYYGNAYELAADLWNHSPIMREVMEKLKVARPAFTEPEMRKLMSFLYYQRYLDKTGDVLKGKKLLSEKGCLKCHSVRGRGGKLACRLDRLAVHVSPLFMAQAMWNHGPEMAKKMRQLGLKWPRFEQDEIIDLTNYLRILRLESPRKDAYSQPGDPVKGRELFESKGCIYCHGVDGKGGGVALDVTQMELNTSVTKIAGRMWNHGAAMIAIMKELHIEWPQFEGSDIGDLISYLYFVNFLGQHGDGERGKRIFNSKGCIRCHSRKEDEQRIGPDLSEMKSLDSPVKMALVMWNHAPNMETKMKELDLEWPEFGKGEIRDLFEFLINVNGLTRKNR